MNIFLQNAVPSTRVKQNSLIIMLMLNSLERKEWEKTSPSASVLSPKTDKILSFLLLITRAIKALFLSKYLTSL